MKNRESGNRAVGTSEKRRAKDSNHQHLHLISTCTTPVQQNYIMSSDKSTDNPWNQETSQKFESKRPGEYFDPCQEAASRSLKCLARNGGDRDMCTDYFQAYRDCKKQWIEQRKESKKKAGWFA